MWVFILEAMVNMRLICSKKISNSMVVNKAGFLRRRRL